MWVRDHYSRLLNLSTFVSLQVAHPKDPFGNIQSKWVVLGKTADGSATHVTLQSHKTDAEAFFEAITMAVANGLQFLDLNNGKQREEDHSDP